MDDRPVRRKELLDVLDLRARSSLAREVRNSGNLHAARQLQEAIVAELQSAAVDDRPECFGARLSLAETMFLQRDLAGARAVQESTLADMESSLTPDHVYILSARAALADTLEAQGELARARSMRQVVSRGLANLLPAGHPDLLAARSKLARTSRRLGDTNGALGLQTAVLNELELASAPASAVDRERGELAATLADMGAFERAVGLLAGVVEALAEDPSADLLALLRARTQLARVLLRSGDLAGARAVLERAWDDSAQALPEGDAERLGVGVELCAALVVQGEGSAARELGALVGRLLLQSLRSVLVPVVAPEVATEARLDALEQAASRWLGGASAFGSTDLRIELAGALRYVSRYVRVAALGSGASPEPAGRAAGQLFAPEAIASRLSAGAVAIELVKTTGWIFTPESGFVSRAPTLSGHVIRSDATSAILELGPAKEIEGLARAWVRAVREFGGPATDAEESVGNRLREQLFDPLRAHLGAGTRTLQWTSTDALAALPLDALPFDGGTLGDAFRIEREASARPRSVPEQDSGSMELLVVGDVALEGRPEDARPPPPRSPAIERRRMSRVAAAADLAAGGESSTIRWLSRAYRQAYSRAATVLTGPAATKAAFCRLAPGKRFLHLSLRTWWDERALEVTDPPSSTIQSRGSSVGFLLAGAHRGRDERGRVPGVLTAEEVAAIDLSTCRLVVLAGAGESLNGPELATWIAGLRAAGVETVVASLRWVDPAAQHAFFESFYRRLWAEEGTPEAALDEARRELRRQGRPKREWAGWIVAGGRGPSALV